MATIYHDASLVLAASQSDGASGGLLEPTFDHSRQHQEIGKFKTGIFSTTRAYARIASKDTIDRRLSLFYLDQVRHHLSDTPLAKRAWTLQEALMARRIVYFTGNELLWECTDARRCECLRSDLVDDDDAPLHGVLMRQLEKGYSPKFIYDVWWDILKDFTARNITRESDRLPALSGLAKFLQSHNAGEYLAGFWKGDILRSLLWCRAPHVVLKRLENPKAPTWSPFSYFVTEKESRTGTIHIAPIEARTGVEDFVARLVDTEAVPYGEDPTGHVKICALTLAGRMLPVGRLDRKWLNPDPVFDERYQWDDEKEDWVFFIMRKNFSGKFSDALVLRPSKKFDGCYERLGVVMPRSGSYGFPAWENSVETTIKIV